MKLIPMIVASLFLAFTSWAQNSRAADGRKSKSMPTLNDSRMVAQPLRSTSKGLLPNYGNALASHHGIEASLPSQL
jgi:hypothetical protein